MKIKLFVLALALLVVGGVLLILRSMPDRVVKTTRSQTAILINSIFVDFDALEKSEQESLLLHIKTQSDSIGINREFGACLMAKMNNPWPLNGFDSSGSIFHDAWGRPLLFCLTNNTNYYEKLNPALKSTSRPFVIWSSGQNLTNEFGFGDDTFIGR